MSIAKVGNEMLPNVFVKNIEVYDESEKEYYFRVETVVYDAEDANGKMIWSSEGGLSEYLNVIFYVEEGDKKSLGIDLESGLDDLAKRSASKDVQIKKIKNYNVHKVNSITHFIQSFEFKAQKHDNLNLKIYCTVSADRYAMASELGYRTGISDLSYRGPLTSEVIFKDGVLAYDTNAFVRANGTQYIGPVHNHPGKGLMEGSFHSDAAHNLLTAKKAFNYKIKDYRKKKYTEREVIDNNFYSILSDLFISHNRHMTSACFALNIKDMVLKETKYGPYLESMNPRMLKDVMAALEFKSFEIKRSRVISKMGTNSTNTPVLQEERRLQTKTVASTRSSKTTSIQANVKKTTTKKPDRQKMDFPEASDKSPEEVEKYDTEVTSYISEISLNKRNNIKYYEFSDLELNVRSPGTYKYYLSFMFQDPTVLYVEGLAKNFKQSMSHLLEYQNYILQRQYYDTRIKKTTAALKDLYFLDTSLNQNLNLSANVNLSQKINSVLRVYDLALNLMYNITDQERKTLMNQASIKLHPNSITRRSLESFIQEFNIEFDNLIRRFDLKYSDFFTHDMKSVPRITQGSKNIIAKEYSFHSMVEPRLHRNSYNVINFETENIENDPRYGIPKITNINYKKRTSMEMEKYFKQSYNQDAPVNYLTPYSISNKEEDIDLEVNTADNIKKINSFFDNKQFFMNTNVKNSQNLIDEERNLNLFIEESGQEDIIPLTEDEGLEKFVHSDKYIGLAVDYTEEDADYKIFDDNKASKDKQLKLNSIRNAINRNMKNTFNKSNFSRFGSNSILTKAKTSLSKGEYNNLLSNMPPSVRSLLDSDKPYTKNSYADSKIDVYESSETKNIVNIKHLKISKIEYLLGFYEDKRKRANLSKPLFATLNEGQVNTNTPKICRISWYENDFINVKSDSLNMPINNSTFLLYEQKEGYFANDSKAGNSSVNSTQRLLTSIFNKISIYDIDGLTNNIVTQNDNGFSKLKNMSRQTQTSRVIGPSSETKLDDNARSQTSITTTTTSPSGVSGGGYSSGGGSQGGGGGSQGGGGGY